MSDANKETIADIIAEMREIHVAEFQDYADRLEAAHRRELAAGGDAAKLREALLRCDAIAQLPEVRNEQSIKDMRNIIKRALSAPPRNCERFATADDAKREFNYLWNFVWQRGGGCLAERNYEEEFERWLFAHATEKEGGAK